MHAISIEIETKFFESHESINKCDITPEMLKKVGEAVDKLIISVAEYHGSKLFLRYQHLWYFVCLSHQDVQPTNVYPYAPIFPCEYIVCQGEDLSELTSRL